LAKYIEIGNPAAVADMAAKTKVAAAAKKASKPNSKAASKKKADTKATTKKASTKAKKAEADDEDDIGYFTKNDYTDKFKDELTNQGDLNVILIRFASEEDQITVIRQQHKSGAVHIQPARREQPLHTKLLREQIKHSFMHPVFRGTDISLRLVEQDADMGLTNEFFAVQSNFLRIGIHLAFTAAFRHTIHLHRTFFQDPLNVAS